MENENGEAANVAATKGDLAPAKPTLEPKRSWSAFTRRNPRPSSSAPDHRVPLLETSPPPAEQVQVQATSSTATPLATTSASSVCVSPRSQNSSPTVPPLSSSTSTVGLERRTSGLKWFQRKTPPSMAEVKEQLSPRDSDKKESPQPSKEKENINTSTAVETICSVSYADLKRQLDMLKRENTRLRFENSHLFKELDIVHRRLSVKMVPPQQQRSSLDILSSHTVYSYNIDSSLTLNIPLDQFLAQYYQDYPESLADLTIYQRKGKLASFSIRNSVDGGEEDEQNKIKANLESALISQEDGKFQNPDGPPRHESFIPTVVKRQFARDVPSMVRINGKMVNGRTDNEKVLVAYRILHDGLRGNEKLANLLMSLANQNLGIFMYEKLVRHYQQIGMIVKQSWHHYVDISLNGVKISKYTNHKNVINELVEEYLRKERAEREAHTPRGSGAYKRGSEVTSQSFDSNVIYLSDEESSSTSEREDFSPKKPRKAKRRDRRVRRKRAPSDEHVAEIDEEKAKLVEGISIYMLAIFELQNTDLDGAPLFIKGMMEITFCNTPDGGSVKVLYSTPAFDVLSFVHSIDLDGSSASSPSSSTESETTETETDERRRPQHPASPSSGGEDDGVEDEHAEPSNENGNHGAEDGLDEHAHKMKEAHDEDWLAKEKEATSVLPATNPDNQEHVLRDAGDVKLHDATAKVVLQKGRRRRVVSRGKEESVDVELAETSTAKRVDSGDDATEGRPRGPSFGRKEDEEWFRRMDEQSGSSLSHH